MNEVNNATNNLITRFIRDIGQSMNSRSTINQHKHCNAGAFRPRDFGKVYKRFLLLDGGKQYTIICIKIPTTFARAHFVESNILVGRAEHENGRD